MDGVGIQAWKDGARLDINEIDHAGTDVMSCLHAILDDLSSQSIHYLMYRKKL